MSLHHQFARTSNAAGAVLARRIVAYAGAADGSVKQAVGPADRIIGVSSDLDAADGKRVDVILSGPREVIYGGAVGHGDPLTSDAQGRAVVAAAGQRIAGWALIDGAAGDIGQILINVGKA